MKTTYYEYVNKEGTVVLLDKYEWSRGLGLENREVKKAQSARKREIEKGFAITTPA